MGISGLDRAGFDAMVDFVQKSYEHVEVSDTLGLDPLAEQKGEEFNEKKEDLVRKLDGSIREAAQGKQKPVEQLLKDMRGAVRTATPDAAPNPGVLQHFERQGEKVRTEQDTFGAKDADHFQLPSVFGEAMGFLKTVFADKPLQPKGDAGKPTATSTTASAAPNGKTDGTPAPKDPRVAEFVATYFGDHFDGAPKPVTEKQFAAALPKTEKEAFAKLPPEEKAFVQ